MRFNALFIPGLLLLAGFSLAHNHSRASFGPEISAEDFNQHVRNLQTLPGQSEIEGRSLKLDYLQAQFTRLGIAHQALNCAAFQGVHATLPGTERDHPAVLYIADWQHDPALAGLLEIAERFMTQRPRPRHDVVFVMANTVELATGGCGFGPIRQRIALSDHLATLTAPALVQALNQLHIAGK